MIWANRKSILPALIVLSVLQLSLDAPTHGQENQDEKNNPLKLTVTVFATRYCVNREIEDSPVRGAVVGTVLFDLHLRIQNISDHAIILCRKCVEADASNVFDIQADGTRGALRQEPMIEDTFGLTARVHHPKRPDSDYPIIPSGGHMEMDRSAGVGFVIFSEVHVPSNKAWIYPGRYFFQARFLSWGLTEPGAKDLARCWKSCAELYDEEIAAEPMPIEIEMPQQAMPDCRAR
jgi:hypothetical protein